jgi:hypothetical protein
MVTTLHPTTRAEKGFVRRVFLQLRGRKAVGDGFVCIAGSMCSLDTEADAQ